MLDENGVGSRLGLDATNARAIKLLSQVIAVSFDVSDAAADVVALAAADRLMREKIQFSYSGPTETP